MTPTMPTTPTTMMITNDDRTIAHGTMDGLRSSRRRSARALLVSAALLLTMLMGPITVSVAAAVPLDDPTEHFNWVELDYQSKDVAGEPLQDGEQPMSPPMILMLVNFGIVLIIIGWKVRPPVLRYVRQRHDSIKLALDEAASLREQAKKKLDEYTEKVSEAEAEVEALIKQIRADAEAEKQRIIADAKAQAEALKRDAEARIAAEIERARATLEREVVTVAIAAAEKMIREQATTADQTRLIDTFISDVRAEGSASKEERV
jgi:F-type H+-transporting ATPase subunit b